MEYRVKSKLDSFLNSKGIEKGWLAEQIKAERASISRWCKMTARDLQPSSLVHTIFY